MPKGPFMNWKSTWGARVRQKGSREEIVDGEKYLRTAYELQITDENERERGITGEARFPKGKPFDIDAVLSDIGKDLDRFTGNMTRKEFAKALDVPESDPRLGKLYFVMMDYIKTVESGLGYDAANGLADAANDAPYGYTGPLDRRASWSSQGDGDD